AAPPVPQPWLHPGRNRRRAAHSWLCHRPVRGLPREIPRSRCRDRAAIALWREADRATARSGLRLLPAHPRQYCAAPCSNSLCLSCQNNGREGDRFHGRQAANDQSLVPITVPAVIEPLPEWTGLLLAV